MNTLSAHEGGPPLNMPSTHQSLALNMVDQQLRRRGIDDRAVLAAMGGVPRHRFVPHVTPKKAYSDHALATAEGQTISQPYMVAIMTQLLRIQPGMRVLEIGTGSGYQTAVLACLGARVITIERSQHLAQSARQLLDELGWAPQIQWVQADGTLGWPEEAPYDRILVTAAAPHLPQAYPDQLGDPGRIVIPIGDQQQQHLMTFLREGDQWSKQKGLACKFVPLIGLDGWPD